MRKKNILALASALSLAVCTGSISANAADSVNVKVTVSDSEGKLVLVQQNVEVTDIDNDGALTINDALYIAHENNFSGGAEAGYSSSKGQYGLSLDKLWGTANGGSYGYYVNDKAAMSLADTVSDGDYINAFIYTDLSTWSDKYSWFDKKEITAEAGEKVSLTLSEAGYDANWAPVTFPVKNAVITLNGEKTEFVTDESGKVEVTFENGGSYTVSAVSESEILVPPVCAAAVNSAQTTTAEPVTTTTTSTTVTTTAETTTADTTTSSSSTTTKSNGSSSKTDSPKTGDNFSAVLAAAFVSVGVFAVSRKRND